MNDDDFQPDWASPPGDTISAILEERHLSLKDFAAMINMTDDEVRALLNGDKVITSCIAHALSQTLGSTPHFWTARDKRYREDASRLVGNNMSTSTKNIIYTIGYGNRTPEQFFAMLPSLDSATLIDVRYSPRGWHIGYSRKQLERKFGDAYLWFRLLGNTSGSADTWVPPTPDNGVSAEDALQGIAECMQHGMKTFANVILMCAEVDHARCHRRFVAEALAALTGAEIVHL